MNNGIEKVKKSLRVRGYLLKIYFKSLFTYTDKGLFKNIDYLGENLKSKNSVVVLCSGPSATRLKPKAEEFYLVTNDSFKIVKEFSFLYYVNDGYFFRRFVANNPLCKNHTNTLFFYRDEDKLHHDSFNYFKAKLKLTRNTNYLISNFETGIMNSGSNYKQFMDFLKYHDVPLKFQNSGVFLLLFGFYLAVKHNKNLEIYGLDLGKGGNIHFQKGGVVGKSITKDSVKINTKKQLEIIYKVLGGRVVNHSNFNPN